FRLSTETLGDFRIAREMRMQNLDHDLPLELRLLRDVDLGHSAAAVTAKNAISVSRRATEPRQLIVGALEGAALELRQRFTTAVTRRRRRSIPRAALRTEHSVSPRTAFARSRTAPRARSRRT